MQLAPYHGHERVDHSMLWTEGRDLDLDGGFREVRVLWDTGHLQYPERVERTPVRWDSDWDIFFRAMGQECNLEDGSRGVCAAPSR